MGFRQLVLERRAEYAEADKRKDKHRIAREIIQTVRSRGGRFLQRVTNDSGSESLVRPREGIAWKLVDDSPALFVKVKQLMRDVGPEAKERRNVRRQRKRLEEDEFMPRQSFEMQMNNPQQASFPLLSQAVPQSQPHPVDPPQPQQEQVAAGLLQQLSQLVQHQGLSQSLQQEQRQRDQNLQILLSAILQGAAPAPPPTPPPTQVNPAQLLLQLLQQAQQPQAPPHQTTSVSSAQSLLFSLVNQQTQHTPAPSPPVDSNVLAFIAALLGQAGNAPAPSDNP
mmetsp:Transcript_4988/g.9486  ORF Transcript_4988/g.9486 Transcript_4988/m.9486 type:complete len:281 (+) Transcript_4988:2-844(+)